jgi:hypothetical protein
MSIVASAIGFGAGLLGQVTDPTASAPDGLAQKVNLVLGIVKWASLMGVLGLFLASGMVIFAGDRGYGGGMSPELKSSVIKGALALVLVASAAQIVNFVMA